MRKCSLTEVQISDLRRLIETTQLTYEELADQIQSTYKVIWRFVTQNYSKEYRLARKSENYRQSKLGGNNPQFGLSYVEDMSYPKYRGASGYVVIKKPEWYTARKTKNNAYEHVIIMCQLLGLTQIPAGFVVHHLDRDRANNKPDNLTLLTLEAHARLHAIERAETRLYNRRGVTSSKREAAIVTPTETCEVVDDIVPLRYI